ncbi:DUF397 domain-containing protein [Streptomyces niveiscabiei]|uniref:DUF397 domain-containing protein n=1 Tax=Streptomyces niveiscabiei TaxID=164115 RepID=UPI0029A0813F|nr:DUF397 domain-containing protein [Streptomyces niveiscabiei]MDX3386663.1 DUF397 domain-containing protein [Streptomyces niveiscabiei]
MRTLTWRKSSYSAETSNCLEIAPAPTTIHIRDSKTPTTPHLTFPHSAWARFLTQVRQ